MKSLNVKRIATEKRDCVVRIAPHCCSRVDVIQQTSEAAFSGSAVAGGHEARKGQYMRSSLYRRAGAAALAVSTVGVMLAAGSPPVSASAPSQSSGSVAL